MTYTTDGKYNVYADKLLIARSYVATSVYRNYGVKILQGMNRTKTIKKICEDCPDFAKENEIDENYHPYLFSRMIHEK